MQGFHQSPKVMFVKNERLDSLTAEFNGDLVVLGRIESHGDVPAPRLI